ncbi:hypothetical protein IFM89_012652 [Coptis chinensis]|uniref:Probable purine permease n=1 Tax=Coptis chinensis TaxID=261450 RepID=A0A835I3R5_9MAGN|nr:hypothetical protein IFM89_012652 [Coptis chinensis]
MSMALVDQSFVDGDVGNYGMEDSRSRTMPAKRSINWLLLLLYSTFAAAGAIGGPLLQRLYYMHGGSRKWFSSWLQCVGFILLVIPISFLYLKGLSSKRNITSKVYFFMEPKLLLSSAVIGILIGFDNYMYSAGLSYIPVSTSALLFSTQLAFTALFAFFIVKQKFTFYSLNAVIVMTLGAVVLALHTNGDRPPGVSKEKYLLGFFFTLGGAALLGLSMPLIEKVYSKSSRPIDYLMVLQFQFVLNFFATCVCTLGMLIHKDFKEISSPALASWLAAVLPDSHLILMGFPGVTTSGDRAATQSGIGSVYQNPGLKLEATSFGIGETKYYLIIVASALVWQFQILGIMGVINCTSSLFAGILTSVILPFTEIAAIVTFKEKFTGEKGLSLALCLWGFTSYFIGEYKTAGKTSGVVELTEDGVKDKRSTDLESADRM